MCNMCKGFKNQLNLESDKHMGDNTYVQNMDKTDMENRKCKILIYSNFSACLYINVITNFCDGHLEFVKKDCLGCRRNVYL